MTTNELTQLVLGLYQQHPNIVSKGFADQLTSIYGILVVVIGWVTHANWHNVLGAWSWLKEQGGVFGILKSIFVGNKTPKA
jgi:hypothetical protein